MSVSPTQLTGNGAPVTGCGIEPGSANASSFPGTLSVNATSCVISGTPAAPLPATLFSVVASNSAGTSVAAVLTLAVNAVGVVPTLSYVGASGTTDNVGTPMSVSPTTLAGNGSAITGCGVKPGSANAASFPGSLSVNASTCVISGTPATLLPATAFTLVATSSMGTSADATVTLTLHAGWLAQLGVASLQSYAYGAAVDSVGNGYVAGTTSGGLDGNSQTGQDDYFIGKYDAVGTLTWLKQLGAASADSEAHAVAVDAAGNSYVAGYTSGGLGGNSQTGQYDYFIGKYDAAGTLSWLRQLGVAAHTSEAFAVAVDSAGNSYVAGYTSAGLDGNSQTGQDDSFIAKYDPSGALTWLKQLGVASQESVAGGAAVDSAGNIYVAGYTTGGLDGNSQTGQYDSFLAKYDPSGTLSSVKQLGAASKDSAAGAVAVDAAGNVYVAGYTSGGLDGNSQSGDFDCFLAKYDAQGTLSWLKQLGVAGLDTEGSGVAVDAAGNVYVAGFTSGGLDGNSQSGLDDYFIAKYDGSGTLSWLKQLGAASGDTDAYGVAVDAAGNSYVAGGTSVGLDGNSQTGEYDYFLANYNSAGSF